MGPPLLYYITDRTQFAGNESAGRLQLLDKIADAADVGIEYIKIRVKVLVVHELVKLAREAISMMHKHVPNSSKIGRSKLLINSRTDIALAVNADGVHLTSDDFSPAEVRKIAQAVLARNPKPETRNFVVAVSCHAEEEVRLAAQAGADFIVFAPVFEKHDNPTVRGAGLDALAQACQHKIPVFALGGVTVENARLCVVAGAAGIAGIRLFQENAIAKVVRALGRSASNP